MFLKRTNEYVYELIFNSYFPPLHIRDQKDSQKMLKCLVHFNIFWESFSKSEGLEREDHITYFSLVPC